MPYITAQGAGLSGGGTSGGAVGKKKRRCRKAPPSGSKLVEVPIKNQTKVVKEGSTRIAKISVPEGQRTVKIVESGHVVGVASVPEGYRVRKIGGKAKSAHNMEVSKIMKEHKARGSPLTLAEASQLASQTKRLQRSVSGVQAVGQSRRDPENTGFAYREPEPGSFGSGLSGGASRKVRAVRHSRMARFL